ncbi:hypothetical protein ASZ90_017892 [hydrocarbon metagenome]|uniref:Uncharacterized protein n=1 Tax=hydrocarbon metagenome TaxID=938273 RepID=A0A0W8E8Q7_9ZZZZ
MDYNGVLTLEPDLGNSSVGSILDCYLNCLLPIGFKQLFY